MVSTSLPAVGEHIGGNSLECENKAEAGAMGGPAWQGTDVCLRWTGGWGSGGCLGTGGSQALGVSMGPGAASEQLLYVQGSPQAPSTCGQGGEVVT